jgi:hypothetical protein
MSAAGLTVWLEPYDEGLAARVGVLCRRHADAMVVPRGWTLDDRRESVPRLFHTPEPARDLAPQAKPKRTRKRHSDDDTGQLELVVPADSDPATEPVPDAQQPAPRPELDPEPSVATDSDGTPFSPWRPRFDQSDDLDGLLMARSPLLSRAFRGKGRAPDERPEH